MTRTNSTIGLSAVAFLACGLVGLACSSSSDTPNGSSAGSPAFGGSGNAAGSPSAAGSVGKGGSSSIAGSAGTVSGSAGSGTGGAGGAGGVNTCTPLPANHLLTDFSPATLQGVTEGTSWTVGKQSLWGSATSLTGGDAFYQGKPGSAAKVTLHGETLTVTATIEAGDYMGYMFNFGPKCTNASATQGLQFDVLPGSTLGNATLKVQMQQKPDYPSTANPGTRPGDCVPTNPATQYNECLSPGYTVASSGSTLNTGTTQLPWSNFSGGAPMSTLDSGQLMAIQWQFECPPDGGTLAAGGSGGDSGGGGLSSSAGGNAGGSGTAGAETGGVSSGGAAGASGAAFGGSSGESGIGGAGGSSGTAGSGAASGSGGGAGSSSVGGASGVAGSSAAAGSSGAAGSSAASLGGTAGIGGSGTSTPPCVVSFTFDNVTFY